jgi:hypothetical protein
MPDLFNLPLDWYTAKEDRKAAQEAAQIQSNASTQGIEMQERMLREGRQIMDPYVQAGYTALYGGTPSQSPTPPPMSAVKSYNLPEGVKGKNFFSSAYDKVKDAVVRPFEDPLGAPVDKTRQIWDNESPFSPTDFDPVMTDLGIDDADPFRGDFDLNRGSVDDSWFGRIADSDKRSRTLDADAAMAYDGGEAGFRPGTMSAQSNPQGGLFSYINAGEQAAQVQRDLAGINGPDAQQAAIDNVESNPLFQSLIKKGENAILQNRAATGGLRGGNIQAQLTQYRPEMLSRELDRQYGRLGGLASTGLGTAQNVAQLGQAAGAGQAAAGIQTGASVAGLMGDRGAALAGGALAPSPTRVALGNYTEGRRAEDAQLWGAGTQMVGNLAGSYFGGL